MKHGRSAQDLADLATRLQAVRVEGLPVSVWLERHHERLQSLVPLGWTWDQLADAMNAADIRYKSGKRLPTGGVSRGSWTGEQLRNAVRHTRAKDVDRRVTTHEVLSRAPVSPSPQEIVQRSTDDPRPVVSVLDTSDGKPAPQPSPASSVGQIAQFASPAPASQPEQGILERQAAAKAAETQRIVGSFLHRRRQRHDQKG